MAKKIQGVKASERLTELLDSVDLDEDGWEYISNAADGIIDDGAGDSPFDAYLMGVDTGQYVGQKQLWYGTTGGGEIAVLFAAPTETAVVKRVQKIIDKAPSGGGGKRRKTRR